MVNDVKRRAPFYASDWVDAWDYRVVPATVYMYFAKYLPPKSKSKPKIQIQIQILMLTGLINIVFYPRWRFRWICKFMMECVERRGREG